MSANALQRDTLSVEVLERRLAAERATLAWAEADGWPADAAVARGFVAHHETTIARLRAPEGLSWL